MWDILYRCPLKINVFQTYVEVGIPDGWLGWWPAAAGIFVQQEAKYIQQEEDRDNVQIREKTLQKRLKFLYHYTWSIMNPAKKIKISYHYTRFIMSLSIFCWKSQ